MCADDVQKFFTIGIKLALPYARDAGELGTRAWAVLDHFGQGGIVKHHVRRYPLGCGQFAAPGAQRFPQTLVGGVAEGGAGGAFGALLLGLDRFSIAAQPQTLVTAQHGAAYIRQMQPAVTFNIHREQTTRDQLSKNSAPGIGIVVLADAEGALFVMTKAFHTLVAFP